MQNETKHIESKHEGVKFPCDECDNSPDFLIDLEIEVEIENETISQWRFSISSVYNCVQLYTDEIL